MTRRALGVGLPACGRWFRVTPETTRHAGELVTHGELELVHATVAVPAADVPREVLAVREVEVRFGHHGARDPALRHARSEVTVATLAALALACLHPAEVSMIDIVATVAGRHWLGQQPIGASVARRDLRVAARAALTELDDVSAVVEAERDRLRREDLVARCGAQIRPRRHPGEWHRRVVGER
jgi:hypothetical protein